MRMRFLVEPLHNKLSEMMSKIMSRLLRKDVSSRVFRRRRRQFAIEMMEDRRPFAVTSFAFGQLIIDFNAANEKLTISSDGTSIALTSSAPITGAGATFSAANVNRIVFSDSTNQAGQSLTIASGGPQFTLANGLSGSGVESVSFVSPVITTGSSGIDVSAGIINSMAPLTTAGGAITLQASNGIAITKPIVSNGGVQNLQADADGNGTGVLSLDLAVAQLVDPNPAPGNQFGDTVVVLTSGNVVVTSPFDDFGGSNAGAVYLFDGLTGAVISTLRGSKANDSVGNKGVTPLSNGNYVVRSSNWDNGTIFDTGAVTWGSGTSGISGVVSAANSLVGSTANDKVGSGGVTALSNGNYVVGSSGWDNGTIVDAGAVTWGSGTSGISGVINASNSLVGSRANDTVGGSGVTALSNGNYVVRSSAWDNGTILNAGAVTWGSGTSGISGVVSAANSLVGSTTSDLVGSSDVTKLSNGNYVVISSNWDNGTIVNAGAVTWGSSTSGISGVVSAANSLVGSRANDTVGGRGVTALSNGNYVVISSNWDNGTIVDAGAVTWGSGTSGISGVVTAANSLVGSTASDFVGSGVTALSNGNYVVMSSNWDNGTIVDTGAVTWGSGTSGIIGVVNAANSLVGSTASDFVGNGGVTALSNGNYVVLSLSWDNGTIGDAGAVTWGSGTSGIGGVVSAANSLVGSSEGDQVGSSDVTALSNGNYVVSSSSWDNGTNFDAGAVTWGSGTSGISGVVSAANSLVGSTARDLVGGWDVTALSNGNYVVISSNWDHGTIVNAGAVTWGSGTSGISGVVSAANSLVGSTASDFVGSSDVTALSNGNYLVRSSKWDNGTIVDAGAVTWGSGTGGISGVVSAANSLVGSTASDFVGIDIVTPLSNGNYVVRSSYWDNGTIVDAGAVTWGSGTSGISGLISMGNSIVGNAANAGRSGGVAFNMNVDTLIAPFPTDGGGRTIVGSQSLGFGTVAGSLVSGSGSVSLRAADINLLGSITSNNSVLIAPQQTNRPIDLGTNAAGTLGLTDAELDRITADILQIGDANSGAIKVSAALTHDNNLSLTNGAGITFNQAITMASDRNFSATTTSTALPIDLATTNADIAASGTGSVSLTATRNIALASGSSVTTVNGNLSLSANQQPTSTSGNFIGIDVNNGLIQTTGTGNLSVLGRGGNDAAGSQLGINTRAGTDIIGGTTGTVSVIGTGGASPGNFNYGVSVLTGSEITSGGGAVSVTGTEGGGPSGTSIFIDTSSVTTATNGGTLSLIGNSMDFGGTAVISAGATGSVTLRPRTNGTLINLGGSDVLSGGPLTLGLTDAELDRVTAGKLVIGSANSGAISIISDVSRPASTDIDLPSAAGNTVNNGVNLNSNGGTISPAGNSNLAVNGSVTGPVTVPSGSMLLGSGTIIGNVTGTGVISPGNNGIGTLTIQGDFTPTGSLRFDISGNEPGSQYDQIVVSGTTTLTDSSLAAIGGSFAGIVGYETFTLINSGTLHGTITSLADGSVVDVHGKNFRALYTANSFQLIPDHIAPTDINLSTNSVLENLSPGEVVGTLTTTDPNPWDVFSYSLVSNVDFPDNRAFNIIGSSLRANSSFDFETKSSYSVRIRSTDQGGLFTEKVFIINVTDVNETPTDISLSANSIAENAGANATVGTLSTSDPDVADTFTYSLVSGAGSTDNADFNISGSSLRAISSFDFETKSSYSVRIRSVDHGGRFTEKVFTISITNTNELVSVTVNGVDSYLNPNQRSQVTSIVVVTESKLASPQSAFSLVNIGLLSASSTNLASSQIFVTNVGNVHTIRFGAGTGVVTRAGTGTLGNSLADGNWILTVSGSEVTGSNQFGNRSVDRFFRMFGDSDGDGDVDGVDSVALRRAQLAATYNAALDWDGNGSVTTGVDINNFSPNLNKRRRTF